MNQHSRREFLKRSGLFAASVPSLLSLSAAEQPNKPFAGRAFGLTEIFSHRDSLSTVVGTLAPDSVTTVSRITPDGHWYQVAEGYVRRSAIQPILPYVRPQVSDSVGFWAEQIAPLSVVREYCAGHAPILARLGFGAMVYVTDKMVDDQGQSWYGLASDDRSELVGWAPALHYALWTRPSSAVVFDPLIKIDILRGELTGYDGGKRIAQTVIRYWMGPVAPAARTSITVASPGSAMDHILLGVPWLMSVARGERVYGVFWHNQFGPTGTGLAVRQPAIELSTFAARWLYEFLLACPEQSAVVVIE
jgi:hypothetical protein